MEDGAPVRVGCLAVQGSYREHLTALARIPGVQAIEVRTKEELNACQVNSRGEGVPRELVAVRSPPAAHAGALDGGFRARAPSLSDQVSADWLRRCRARRARAFSRLLGCRAAERSLASAPRRG